MKKLINSIVVILLCVTSLQATGKEPKHLIVEGEFLNDKNVNYTIFQSADDGKFVAVEHVKARKYFLVECNIGYKYIVRFQNKKGDVKFLMIDAAQKGYFMVDVDWQKPYDGKITFEKTGYALTPFTNSAESYLTNK